jgi:hypothetical protein
MSGVRHFPLGHFLDTRRHRLAQPYAEYHNRVWTSLDSYFATPWPDGAIDTCMDLLGAAIMLWLSLKSRRLAGQAVSE